MTWEEAPLGEVAKIERKGVHPRDVSPTTAYLGLEDIEPGGHIVGHKTVGEAGLASAKFRFDDGHVLFGKLRPNLGKVARPQFSGVCSTDILPIRPGSRLDRAYLQHYLGQPSMVRLAASRATGASLPRLSPAVLAEFQIPLPPIDEQRRIVTVLDAAQRLMRLRRRQLELLDEMSAARTAQLFAGVTRLERLKDVSRRVTVGHVGPTSEHLVQQGVPLLRTQNIRDDYISNSALLYVNAQFASQLKNSTLRAGDVLISRHVVDRIRTAVLPPELDGANCANIIVVSPGPALRGEVLAHYLRSPDVQRSLLNRRVGSAQAVVNTKVLQELLVPIPDAGDQAAFRDELVKCAALRRSIVTALDSVTCLQSSLQRTVFPNHGPAVSDQ